MRNNLKPFPANHDRVRVMDMKTLSDGWSTLSLATVEYRMNNGAWQTLKREVYNRGHGATILLYNAQKNTVILTRQFRFPVFCDNHNGMLIETCAGLLDADDPETCVRRESEEETGYRVSNVRKIFEAFMSPGAVTEIVHFFVGEYSDADRPEKGGGIADEGEDIEVLEYTFDEAYAMIADGRIRDGKTIMLLQHAKLSGLMG